MIKKTSSNHMEETENVKWCIFKVTQYNIFFCLFLQAGSWLRNKIQDPKVKK